MKRNATEIIFVRYYPRNFNNEWSIKAFKNLEEAERFADKMNNNVDSSADILTLDEANKITHGFIGHLDTDTLYKLY